MNQYKKEFTLGNSPYRIVATQKDMNTSTNICHFHDFYEIEIVIDGFAHQFINGKDFPLHRGVIYFLTLNDVHQQFLKENEILNMYTIQFDQGFLSPEIMDLINNTGKIYISQLNDAEIMFVLESCGFILSEQKAKSEYSEIIIRKTIESILLLILQKSLHNNFIISSSDILLNQIISYINQNYSSKLTVADIANKFYLTPNYLGARFSEKLNISLLQYIKQLRLNKAIVLISQTDDPLDYIAHKVGYHSYSGFSRDYKEFYGVSPISYRKSIR